MITQKGKIIVPSWKKDARMHSQFSSNQSQDNAHMPICTSKRFMFNVNILFVHFVQRYEASAFRVTVANSSGHRPKLQCAMFSTNLHLCVTHCSLYCGSARKLCCGNMKREFHIKRLTHLTHLTSLALKLFFAYVLGVSMDRSPTCCYQKLFQWENGSCLCISLL